MLVSHQQFLNARYQLPEKIRVLEVSNNDAWIKDTGPLYVMNSLGKYVVSIFDLMLGAVC